MSTTDDLKTYYSNILIMQYNQKPKAIATIQTLSGAAIADNIEGQVKDGFSLDTARGKQLDILGNLVGVSRVLTVALPAPDYFSTVDSDSVVTTLNGFADSDVNGGAVPWYFYGAYPLTSLWSMDDTTYRRFIKYTVKLNKLNHTGEEVGAFLTAMHAEQLHYSDTWMQITDRIFPMAVQVVINTNVASYGEDLLLKAILATKSLPIAAGVDVQLYVDGVLTPY